MIDFQEVGMGHPKRVDFVLVYVKACESGGGDTGEMLHTYIHMERLTHMQLYIVRLWSTLSGRGQLIIY